MDNKNSNMVNVDKTTMKVWKSTRKKLKILAASLDMPMTRLIDNLVSEALESLEDEKQQESYNAKTNQGS